MTVSVCQLLRQRETGLSRCRDQRISNSSFLDASMSPVFQSTRILRELICSSSRTFRPVVKKPMIQQGNFIYEEGKLWSRNVPKKTLDIIDLRELQNSSKKCRPLYSLSMLPRWIDQDFWHCPNFHQIDLVSRSHLSSLFVLRQHPNHCLQRYDISTGTLLQSLKLPDNFRYVEMNCDHETESIILKSRRWPFPKSSSRAFFVLVSFLIFEFPPLNFQHHIEVSKEHFGPNIVDAEINQGILFVMSSNQEVELFSLESLIEAFADKDNKFDISEVNVQVSRKPIALFKVTSEKHVFQMSTFVPYSYIAVQSHKIKAFNMNTESCIGNGNIAKKDYFEENAIFFHPDDSRRVVHVQGHRVRILGLDESGATLTELFDYDASKNSTTTTIDAEMRKETRKKAKEASLRAFQDFLVANRTSRSGRAIKRPSDVSTLKFLDCESDDESTDENLVVNFEFENELDLIVLLVYRDIIKEFGDDSSEDDDEDSAISTKIDRIVFVDNQSLKILKTMEIDVTFSRSQTVRSTSIMLDKDVLLLREKNLSTYSMIPCLLSEDIDTNCQKKKKRRIQ